MRLDAEQLEELLGIQGMAARQIVQPHIVAEQNQQEIDVSSTRLKVILVAAAHTLVVLAAFFLGRVAGANSVPAMPATGNTMPIIALGHHDGDILQLLADASSDATEKSNKDSDDDSILSL
jgi:hypothetical protein